LNSLKKQSNPQTWSLVTQTLILAAEEEQSGLCFKIIRRIMLCWANTFSDSIVKILNTYKKATRVGHSVCVVSKKA
jgi:hypothetical protein